MIKSELHGDMQSATEMSAPPSEDGRNTMNGPKVNVLASLSKIWLYAGISVYPTLLTSNRGVTM